ncbi:hypothetical protein DRB96_40565 [Streptomyces sp. ICC1]|nr:hypothetical protein DRB89_39985 [Streptomyces sp. ICC4]AWZ17372.1 hypothetical protein DRB96_40565 [Streptomyces sp. ICC1]
MPLHRIKVTGLHGDGTVCPPAHEHTRGGAPLTAGCTGRLRYLAACACGEWSGGSSTKSYAAEMGKRHRSAQA